MKRVTPADRDAADLMMGLRDDPEAHGRHKPTNRGRVTCGKRQYKDGFAPCQLAAAPVARARTLTSITWPGADARASG